jgi:nucleoside-diphosphate-sugar epimerase
MKIQGKRVLVTGADGFIGSHLTEHLVRSGVDVRAFVYYNSFNSWGWLDDADPNIRQSLDVFAGDIRDPNGVRTAMQGCDVVLHLAALIAIPYSYHSPDTYVDTNVKGTLNVVQAARELGVERVVHTSTSEVYGTARFVPITEEHPLQGQSPYSASKIGADQIAQSFQLSFGTPVDHPPVQHLWPAPVRARGNPDDHHPDRQRSTPAEARRGASHPRLQLRARHRARLRRCCRM